MRIISVPFLDRGPKVESTIGILIVLVITGMMLSATYSAYKNFTTVIEKNTSYLESSETQTQPSDLKQ